MDGAAGIKEFARNGFAREPEVLDFAGMGRSTLWAKAKSGAFPKPLKLSDRITVWDRSQIWEWYESQKAAACAKAA